MNTKGKRLPAAAAAAAVLFALLGNCGNVMVPDVPPRDTGEEGAPGADGIVHVTGISLDYTSVALTMPGTVIQQLVPAVNPPNAADQTVTWVSVAPGVATVSASGLVTAVSPGAAIITALTVDGGKTASCVVTVSTPGTANVTSFTAVPGNTTIELGWIIPPVSPNPEDPVFDSVIITSAPAAGSLAAAKVINKTDVPNNAYTVTGLANGTSYTIEIKAHYADGSTSGGTSVTVKPSVPVTTTDLLAYNVIAAPVTGASANTTTSTASAYSQFFKVERSWKKDGAVHTGYFYAGTVYQAVLTITADDAYYFPDLFAFTHGALATPPDIVTLLSADKRVATVTITFPATGGVTVSGTINGSTGLAGASVQLKKEGADYLSPVTTASDGTYEISGVAAGSYTIEVSKPAYGTMTIASFTVTYSPVTGKNTVLKTQVTELPLDLSAVYDAPLPSAPPDTTPTLTAPQAAQYQAAIVWRTAADAGFSGNFEPGTAYKATVTLTAAADYTFTGVADSQFLYTGASSASAVIAANGNTATVTITFPPVTWGEVDAAAASGVTGLVNQLDWIKANGEPGKNYTITLTGPNPVPHQTLSVTTDDKLTNTSITLTGTGTITLSDNGSLFRVAGFSGVDVQKVTLVLAGDIVLVGKTGNTAPLVFAENYAALVMKDNAKIINNESSGGGGGGVYVVNYSSFTMSGGEISGNKSTYLYGGYGGGVYVVNYSSFTMSGGKISGNEATDYGGGVCVISSSSFTMSGGEISGNTTSTYGGGVYFGSSSSSYSFTMSGGEISGNRAATSGGGVYVANTTGRFTKSGTAVIYGDTDTTPGDPENTATSGVGHAAAVVDGRNRNSDALAGATIDTAILGVPGGWD